jgi:hypothetical protein
LNPEKDEIKTIHYAVGVEDFDIVEPKMLYPDEIKRLIDYTYSSYRKTDKTMDAKYQFLFQFFLGKQAHSFCSFGLRVGL